MKKAFSLFELIIVIVLISILTTYIVFKSKDSISLTIKTKIKSDIALIRSSLSKIKTKKVLINNDNETIEIDNASINEKGNLLFEKILDFPLISTNEIDREKGKWIKMSEKDYKIYLNDKTFLEFVFENSSFNCKSKISLCKEYE